MTIKGFTLTVFKQLKGKKNVFQPVLFPIIDSRLMYPKKNKFLLDKISAGSRLMSDVWRLFQGLFHFYCICIYDNRSNQIKPSSSSYLKQAAKKWQELHYKALPSKNLFWINVSIRNCKPKWSEILFKIWQSYRSTYYYETLTERTQINCYLRGTGH